MDFRPLFYGFYKYFLIIKAKNVSVSQKYQAIVSVQTVINDLSFLLNMRSRVHIIPRDAINPPHVRRPFSLGEGGGVFKFLVHSLKREMPYL